MVRPLAPMPALNGKAIVPPHRGNGADDRQAAAADAKATMLAHYAARSVPSPEATATKLIALEAQQARDAAREAAREAEVLAVAADKAEAKAALEAELLQAIEAQAEAEAETLRMAEAIATAVMDKLAEQKTKRDKRYSDRQARRK